MPNRSPQCYTITLPDPCAEDWKTMTPVEKGRHCKACEKVVVDFTKMSDMEIIAFLQNSPSTCGRFRKDSLNRNIYLLPSTQQFLHLPRVVWGMMLGMTLSFRQELMAHNQSSQLPAELIQSGEKHSTDNGKLQIKGIISDSISGNPISGASIYISASGEGTVSDYDGCFNMFVSRDALEQNQSIQISYVGYETKNLELSVLDSSLYFEVLLVQSSKQLDEINIVADKEHLYDETLGGAPVIRRDGGKIKYRHPLWWRILHPFHRCGKGHGG